MRRAADLGDDDLRQRLDAIVKALQAPDGLDHAIGAVFGRKAVAHQLEIGAGRKDALRRADEQHGDVPPAGQIVEDGAEAVDPLPIDGVHRRARHRQRQRRTPYVDLEHCVTE